MADLGVPRDQSLIPASEIPDDIKKLWKQSKCQEYRSQIASYRQQIEDLEKGKIPDLNARIKLKQLELAKIEAMEIVEE